MAVLSAPLFREHLRLHGFDDADRVFSDKSGVPAIRDYQARGTVGMANARGNARRTASTTRRVVAGLMCAAS